MSRLYDRDTRRASPGLDTDLSGLGIGFIYPGNVTRKRLVPCQPTLRRFTTRFRSSPSHRRAFSISGMPEPFVCALFTRAHHVQRILELSACRRARIEKTDKSAVEPYEDSDGDSACCGRRVLLFTVNIQLRTPRHGATAVRTMEVCRCRHTD